MKNLVLLMILTFCVSIQAEGGGPDELEDQKRGLYTLKTRIKVSRALELAERIAKDPSLIRPVHQQYFERVMSYAPKYSRSVDPEGFVLDRIEHDKGDIIRRLSSVSDSFSMIPIYRAAILTTSKGYIYSSILKSLSTLESNRYLDADRIKLFELLSKALVMPLSRIMSNRFPFYRTTFEAVSQMSDPSSGKWLMGYASRNPKLFSVYHTKGAEERESHLVEAITKRTDREELILSWFSSPKEGISNRIALKVLLILLRDVKKSKVDLTHEEKQTWKSAVHEEMIKIGNAQRKKRYKGPRLTGVNLRNQAVRELQPLLDRLRATKLKDHPLVKLAIRLMANHPDLGTRREIQQFFIDSQILPCELRLL